MIKKVKGILVVTAVACSFAFASISNAATADASVAIVDTQKVLENSSAMKDINAQVDKKAGSLKEEYAKKEEYFKKKYEDLEKQKSSLSPDAFNKKTEELAKEFSEAQQKVQKNRQDIDKAFVEAMKKFDGAFLDVVKEVSKGHGHKVVLHKMQTIYSENALDITDEVLQKVNKKISKVKVNF